MIRAITAYFLTSFILLSQVGLPLHFHYCKGMLEAVSVFISPGCDEHEESPDLPACCAKDMASACSKDGGDCCDDRVEVLAQDITSLLPQLEKWNAPLYHAIPSGILFAPWNAEHAGAPALSPAATTGGPPIYIRHHALIYYA